MTRVVLTMLLVCAASIYVSWHPDCPATIAPLAARELRGGANCQLKYGVPECEECDANNRKCNSEGGLFVCYDADPDPCQACTVTNGSLCGGDLNTYRFPGCQGDVIFSTSCDRMENHASQSACDPPDTKCF